MLSIVDRKLVRISETKGSLPPNTYPRGIMDMIFRSKLLRALNHESKLFNVTGLGNTCPRVDELYTTLEYLSYRSFNCRINLYKPEKSHWWQPTDEEFK